MKKYALIVASATLLIACQNPPAGKNKDVLKREAGVERYDDVVAEGHHESAEKGAAEVKKDVDIDLNGLALKGYENGLEAQMITFLKSGAYKNAADDAALKDTWYNFDHVNFKMGSANQLEAGSEGQLENLAKILKAFPEAKIKIGAYTDKTGNDAANQKLSQDRANFIQSELSKLGAGAQVVSAEGYGSKYATVAKEASDEERAIDRKMSVRFSK